MIRNLAARQSGVETQLCGTPGLADETISSRLPGRQFELRAISPMPSKQSWRLCSCREELRAVG